MIDKIVEGLEKKFKEKREKLSSQVAKLKDRPDLQGPVLVMIGHYDEILNELNQFETKFKAEIEENYVKKDKVHEYFKEDFISKSRIEEMIKELKCGKSYKTCEECPYSKEIKPCETYEFIKKLESLLEDKNGKD